MNLHALLLISGLLLMSNSAAASCGGTGYIYTVNGKKHYTTKPPAGVANVRVINYKYRCESTVVKTPAERKKVEQEAAARQAEADAYVEDMYRRGAEAEARRKSVAAEQARYERQLELQRVQIALQQELLEELQDLKRDQDYRELSESLRSINQDLSRFRTPLPDYSTPAVQDFSPPRPQIKHCRTIGYLTTCS